MADDDGGTVLGFPRLTVPGVVADDRPPPDPPPALVPLATDLAPPASLLIPDNPDLSPEISFAEPVAPSSESGGLVNVAAMSTVMMAGITVAALRGAAHFVAHLKARAEHQKTVERQRKAPGDPGNPQPVDSRALFGAAPRGRVQSGPEFGRSTHRQPHGTARTDLPTPPMLRRDTATPGGRTPGKAPHGRSDGQSSAGGSPGAERVREARRGALEASGAAGRPNRLAAGGYSGGGMASSALRGRADGRLSRQPSGPDTVRGAVRHRIADRITHGPREKQARAERTPPGPDTIRGAASRRVADRITTGSWKPTGAHKAPSDSPITIRAALRTRAADRILNGRRTKPEAADDSADGSKDQAEPAATPSTDLVAPVGAPAGTSGDSPADPKAGGGSAKRDRVKPPKRARKRRRMTPGGATGARPWRSRPGRGRSSREGRRRKHNRWWQHAQWWVRWARDRRTEEATPPPGHGAGADGGFGPPPGWGWTEGETITVERADGGPRRRGPRPPAAIGRGQAALPPAPDRPQHQRPGTAVPPPAPPPKPVGEQPVSIPLPRAAHGMQYDDAELTIYDVIEADADMGEEITQGAAEARQAACDCEELTEHLEALHAKILELKVPGILAPAVVRLIEKAGAVKARAEAVAAKIPAAAEAITAAGNRAADRHKGLADAVRDAGHSAPAERDYHNE